MTKRKQPKIYDHTLEECERVSSEYQDYCPECGELTACICLGSIVNNWQIEATGSAGAFAYRYFYEEREGDIVAKFGYAESYRGAMDSIAHAVLCKLEGARV